MNTTIRIAVLLTCHNRRDKTINCLKTLYSQNLPDQVQLSVYLVDDGSTDGTGDSVRQTYPQVKVLQGNGKLFWNRGMHMAFEAAMKEDYDYYLWLNDDVSLYPNALSFLFSAYRNLDQQDNTKSIIVGLTCDPEEEKILTYGGLIRSSQWHPFKFRKLHPKDHLQGCDTMNGNCVLIPRQVVQLVGNLDNNFTHRFGDIDYGLRSKNKGCSIWITPGYIGTCVQNCVKPLRQRIKTLTEFKDLPFNEAGLLARRHGGRFWFFFWVLPYISLYLKALYQEISDRPRRVLGIFKT